jgi:Sensory domain found in PocR
MVHHVNAFFDIGSPGGVAKNVYKHCKDEGTRLAKQRKKNEALAWIFCFAGLVAMNYSATTDFALIGFFVGGNFIYRAIMCRIEESTVETLLHKWDLDVVLQSLIEKQKFESEERMHELSRPATEAELARRGDFVRGLEDRLKGDE